jgi:hypothetical protein
MIVWLDEYIGQPQQYLSLKRVFDQMVNANGVSRLTSDEWWDFENLIRLEREPAAYTTIHFFDKSADCLTFIREHIASTTIFLVTSSQFARIIIPHVINEVYAIYLLCENILDHTKWALEYIEHIQLFDFDTDLIIRLTRDVADYCVQQGKERLIYDPKKALQYFSTARKLTLRANMVDGTCSDSRLDDISNLLQSLTFHQARVAECEDG